MLLSSLKGALGSLGKRRAARALDEAYARSVTNRTAKRFLFADSALPYSANTPYEKALGGSQAAVCYLAEALAAVGHEVVLRTKSEEVARERNVTCTGWSATAARSLRAFKPDYVIALVLASEAVELRRIFGDGTRIILWEHLPADQPSVQDLPAARGVYDAIAFVSDWQSAQYIERFQLDPTRTCVIGNGVGPAFENAFARSEAIGPSKARPPVIAYTSAPYRGLNVLLTVFPEIRRRVPGTRLEVYSGMQLYQAMDKDAQYRVLYDACRTTEGVELMGVVSQPVLAKRLKSVTLYAYPNTFAETFCIAALEAMAAGCRIVTSDLGGLRQTTAGFARLVPMVKATLAEDFLEACIASLTESLDGSDAGLLARQVAYVNDNCTYGRRAQQWLEWLPTVRRE